MAITHAGTLRNTHASDVTAAADAGTTNASARFVFMTSGDVEVSTHPMSNPSFGSPSTGTITAAAISDDTDATGGVIALFRIISRNEVEVIRGTVGVSGSGADMIITNTTIGAGDTVVVDSFSYTAPP